MMQSDVIEADLNRITITDPFLGEYQRLIRDVVIPYQWEALNDNLPEAEPSHALANYRIAAGIEQGDFYGMVFQDSDVTISTRRESGLTTIAPAIPEIVRIPKNIDMYPAPPSSA